MNSGLLEEIKKLDKITLEYNNLFDSEDFLEYDCIDNIVNNLLTLKINFKIKYILNISSYIEYKKNYNQLSLLLSNVKSKIDEHNNQIACRLKINFQKMYGLVENKELDDEQIDAIVRKNKNQLVIAAAGSGKTTTIVGKVKYLLLTHEYDSKDILLLSFTNASSEEMKERVKNETNIDLDVMTFHKLGLEIIKKAYNKNYKIFDKNLGQFISTKIKEHLKKPNYLNKLIYFMSTARFNLKDEFDFKNELEYQEFLNTNKPTTLKGEIVKSYGELEIANYLFSNNIEYIYEQKYKYNTINYEYQQYYPDFYLPEYDIYIEYFGINENNEVAPYFKGKNGLTANESYNRSIEWKRKVHKDNNTIMIETYYYENKQGKLIENLENKIKNYNVKINPKSKDELWETVNKNNNLFDEVCNVFSTIINLIKSNNYTIDYLNSLPQIKKSLINKLTLDLVTPIFIDYQSELNKNEMIDFNDMINMSSAAISNNKYIHNYKYVIIDEYQDMSISRFKLLDSMRKQKDYKLFCVGDDWQSIYRFSGSDLNLIIDFEKYWGNTYISYIERTYRFTSMISKLSGNFIMKNPRQYKKNVSAKNDNNTAIKFINGYTDKKSIEFMEEKLNHLRKNSTVFFLGRYSFDIDLLKGNTNFKAKYNTQENHTNITYLKRKDLNIKFLTIHKSKGLQADYVIILNNKKYGMGFPSKINDLPLVRALLSGDIDDYPYSEERRLFYVALTRAKKQTLLLTTKDNKSIFINELEKDYKNLMKTDVSLRQNIYKCPNCGNKLIPRSGKYGKFIGCSNYPNCKFTRNY